MERSSSVDPSTISSTAGGSGARFGSRNGKQTWPLQSFDSVFCSPLKGGNRKQKSFLLFRNSLEQLEQNHLPSCQKVWGLPFTPRPSRLHQPLSAPAVRAAMMTVLCGLLVSSGQLAPIAS